MIVFRCFKIERITGLQFKKMVMLCFFLQNCGNGLLFHPRATWLGLNPGERIINISAAGIRVSVMTDNGRIATFLDESIGMFHFICTNLLDVSICYYKKKCFFMWSPKHKKSIICINLDKQVFASTIVNISQHLGTWDESDFQIKRK